MKYKLLENPWILATSALATIAAIGNSLASPFGLSPFWADVTTLLILVAAMAHWINFARKATVQATQIGDSAAALRQVRTRELRKVLANTFLAPLLIGVMIVWTAIPVVRQLSVDREWIVCATFVVECRGVNCVRFFDRRQRPLGACHSFTDESGYIDLRPDGMTKYRPFYASRCEASESMHVELPQGAFTHQCESVVRLP